MGWLRGMARRFGVGSARYLLQFRDTTSMLSLVGCSAQVALWKEVVQVLVRQQAGFFPKSGQLRSNASRFGATPFIGPNGADTNQLLPISSHVSPKMEQLGPSTATLARK